MLEKQCLKSIKKHKRKKIEDFKNSNSYMSFKTISFYWKEYTRQKLTRIWNQNLPTDENAF